MSRERARIRILASVALLGAIVFVGRLFYVQVVNGSYFYKLAETQYRSGGQYGIFERGNIYFTTKDSEKVTAAGLKEGFTLAINPTVITDAEGLYKKISQIVPSLSKEDFISHANKKDDPYEELARRLTKDERDKLAALSEKSIILSPEQWRDYPGGSLAAHVLGYVGYSGDSLEGIYGLEKLFEPVLKRNPGDLYQNFFSGLFEGIRDEVFGGSDAHEGDLVLTIEPRVQSLIESKADELMVKWHAKNVGIIVIDPNTGEIAAMANRPTFDPNKFGDEKSVSVFTNPFVQEVFEMGSIMKPITISSGIDAGKITANTTYDDKGYIELDGKRIENYDGRARGPRTTMQDVLNQSLNVGAANAALIMGRDTFREYMYRFGFQDKTGIDLPNETNNLINNLESPRDVEIATASFGQGIAVSPISMVRALCVLGNGGFLIKPHVVKAIDYTIGLEDTTKVTEQGRVISRDTSEEITRMLVKVVDEYLANGKLKLDHYSIAAKTGTAQIANPAGGGYYPDRYLHSFFGYFPAYNPRFLIFMYMNEPVGARYASETLAQPFKEITQFLVSYYEIPPDR